MGATNASSSGAERELTAHQRNHVDTCFEEGQYEAAIALLDELRSHKFKPFPAHIRQLIYIALYPATSIEDQLEEEALKLEPGSPSKMLARRHKSSLAPSAKATDAALGLLLRFSRTNSAKSLASALPSYPDDPDARVDNRVQEEDSYIAQQALRVRNARCCWDILKEGFIQRGNDDVFSSPRKAGTRRSRAMQDSGDEYWDEDAPAAVGDHAWGVLDWMVGLFESDENESERSGQVHYSPLLLRQIPPSRAENTPRWDVEMPLDVAFYALHQDDEKQRSLGVRLLSLLINLMSTTLLDLSMFLNAVSKCVSSLPVDALSDLLTSLPLTRPTVHFKVLLCHHALGGTQAPTTGRPKPKPQARARAQPRRRTRTTTANADPAANAVSGSNSTPHSGAGGEAAHQHSPLTLTPGDDTSPSGVGAGAPPPVARKLPGIPASDLLALLARPISSKSGAAAASSALGLCMKSELVVSYALLQRELAEDERDPIWEDAVRDGSVGRTVEQMCDPRRGAEGADEQSRTFLQLRRETLGAVLSMS